jgi:diamine N-acetyltransferase
MEEQKLAGKPLINVKGEKIAFGPIRREHLPLYVRWMNDFEVTRGTSGMRPMTAEQEQEWYETASKTKEAVHFGIYELGPEESETYLRPVGVTSLFDIDYRNGNAEFGLLIGEKSTWGKGYGTEATTMMLDYGFNVLGLHSIMLRVFSFNEYAVRAYKRSGFRVVGSMRESHRIGSRWYDEIYMDCLASDFQGGAISKYLP